MLEPSANRRDALTIAYQHGPIRRDDADPGYRQVSKTPHGATQPPTVPGSNGEE